MATVNNILNKPVASQKKNGFDLSRRKLFNMNAGELMLVHCEDCVPGDYMSIDMNAVLQGNDINTAAFTRLGVNVDAYFVPYTALWSNFNEFIATKEDKRSSALNDFQYVPYVSLGSLLFQIFSTPTDLTYGYKDIEGESFARGALRLLEMAGYGNFWQLYEYYLNNPADALNYVISAYGDIKVNVFRLAAYQCVWYSFYRNMQYDKYMLDSTNVNGRVDIQPFFWNFDFCHCNSIATSNIFSEFVALNYHGWDANQFVRQLLQMRYRQWKYDMFNGLLPSAQFGGISSISSTIDLNKVKNYGSSAENNILYSTNGGTLYRGTINNSNNTNPANVTGTTSVSLTGSSSFDVLSLWKAEAIQRYNQQLLRAGYKTKNNLRAVYGTEPNFDMHNMPMFLASSDGRINIDRVTATSETTGSKLGQFGGNMLGGVNMRNLKFKADDFGTIIFVAYVLPEADYDGSGLDKNNTLINQSEFFNPYLDDLGLEPVHQYERSVSPYYWRGAGTPTLITAAQLKNLMTSTMGYGPRFHQYKSSVDTVHMGFLHSRGITSGSVLGDFAQFTSVRTVPQAKPDPTDTIWSQELASLYVGPDVLKTIMVVDDTDEDSGYQFLCDFFFDVKAVRNMSVLGMAPNN